MIVTPIGLDLSLTSTGFSCGNDQKVYQTKSRGAERLFDISSMLIESIAGLSNPVILIEGYSFASRNSQAHSIGELGGVVRLALWSRNIPYIEIPPTVRAKFATGKGNASKGEVVSAVSARTGIVWSGSGADDMCDAWILEECGLVRLGRPRFDWPAINKSALDKVDWSAFPDEHN